MKQGLGKEQRATSDVIFAAVILDPLMSELSNSSLADWARRREDHRKYDEHFAGIANLAAEVEEGLNIGPDAKALLLTCNASLRLLELTLSTTAESTIRFAALQLHHQFRAQLGPAKRALVNLLRAHVDGPSSTPRVA
jgi:hypothetical protein